MIQKIYFDMDGVLADFERGVAELCKIEPQDINGVEDPARDDAMWAKIKAVGHFYDKLELLPGAKEMFDLIYGVYGDRCEILTGIPKARRGIVTAGDDKISWVRRLLSKDIKVNIVYRENKPDYCFGKDCILIDDFGRNVREWCEIGGTAIQHISPEETIRKLKELGIL